MRNNAKLIDPEPIKKFIVDGLNNPDQKKAFGHDAIEILTEIEYAPAVDTVKHGRWIKVTQREYLGCYCSRCHKWFCEEYNYCPNCGARMDGEEDV